MEINEFLDKCSSNQTIHDNVVKAYNKINSPLYKKISCSVSGGADSDVMLDILHKVDKDHKVEYVWFDTGIEYQATKDHLKYLEDKYGIEIKRYKAIKPIPVSCKEYGVPFLSKLVSQMIMALQRHNFKWEDKSFDELIQEYPNAKSYLKWWCNQYKPKTSSWNIARNKWLKEFLIENPPTFKISDRCCKYAKKEVKRQCNKENEYNLECIGIRKSEGGIRAAAYKNCFSHYDNKVDEYRPLFFFKNNDKIDYENIFNIIHSKCYTEYGLTRTGCAGCPFGNDFEQKLDVLQKYEPKLYKACNNIFGESYEYTRKYREFYKEMEQKCAKK